jgi:hypothetical protein
MHRSEQREYVECTVCGAETALTERAYAVSEDATLCFRCATARRGIYDEVHDHWVVAPRVDDLVAPPA